MRSQSHPKPPRDYHRVIFYSLLLSLSGQVHTKLCKNCRPGDYPRKHSQFAIYVHYRSEQTSLIGAWGGGSAKMRCRIDFGGQNKYIFFYIYQNKIQWAKHQHGGLCVTVSIRCSSAGGYQTALHCCGRPLLDWGWIACIRRKASCTELRCLYRDGSIRIHVPCHP